MYFVKVMLPMQEPSQYTEMIHPSQLEAFLTFKIFFKYDKVVGTINPNSNPEIKVAAQ